MPERLDRLDRYREIVDDWPAFVDACRRPLPTVVWANPRRRRALARLCEAEGLPAAAGPAGAADADAACGGMLARRLAARGFEVEGVAWHPGALRVTGLDKPGLTLDYHLGLYHVQEEVSLIPPVAMGSRPGERVLDLCAAPGGKTARIACNMDDRGTLVANDVRAGRIRALRGNTERLGLRCVVVTSDDGTRFPLEAGPFDRLLLDVPCSCEGNVRQIGEVPWGQDGEFLTGRSGLQATLLGRAWKLLAPGGTLVYATCTFAPEENEMVLDHVLGEDACILPLSIDGLDHGAGVTRWRGTELRPDCAHVARYWPHLNDTGGFTVARVRREPAPGDEGPAGSARQRPPAGRGEDR